MQLANGPLLFVRGANHGQWDCWLESRHSSMCNHEHMDTQTAITVKYWIATDQGRNFCDLDGIDEFRRELAADYVSLAKGRPTGAGGFTHLYVEVISSLTLSHFIRLLL